MNLVSGKQNWGIRLSASGPSLVSQQCPLQANKRGATQNKLHHTLPGHSLLFLSDKEQTASEPGHISRSMAR